MIRSEVSFKQMFSMFAHLNIIGAIGSIIHGLAVLLIPGINQEISITSLESIVNAGGILGAVLNSVEIFEIWQIIITARSEEHTYELQSRGHLVCRPML